MFHFSSNKKTHTFFLEKEENLRKCATISLLERWWRNEQWSLLFQALAPVVYYSGWLFGSPYDIRPSRLDDRSPAEVILGRLLSTNQERIAKRLKQHWLEKEWDLTRMWGNAFMVKGTHEANRYVREPKHIVFHCERIPGRWEGDIYVNDQPRIFLEQRQYMDGTGNYSSTVRGDDLIYYGVKCMLTLQKAFTYDWYNDENKELLRQISNIHQRRVDHNHN